MRLALQIVTAAVFALHAMLGCALHHTCQHGVAMTQCTAHECHDHDCAGHDHDDTREPADADHDHPTLPCQHSVCSYVKADTTRVSFDQAPLDWNTASGVAIVPIGSQLAQANFDRPLKAGHSTTHLYVWHCALVI